MSAELKMLERAFMAEVENRLPFQTKAANGKGIYILNSTNRIIDL